MFRTCFSHCSNCTKVTPFISALIISTAATVNRWHPFGSLELSDTWQGESNWAPPVCLIMLRANNCMSFLFYARHFLFVLSLRIHHCTPLFPDTSTNTHSDLPSGMKWNEKKKQKNNLNTNVCLTLCTVRCLATQKEVITHTITSYSKKTMSLPVNQHCLSFQYLPQVKFSFFVL